MKVTKTIIPVWQPQGYSTNHLAKKIGELYGVKSTHTGTLDPMAEGIIIVLLDEDRLKRNELSSSIKGYEFEICFGIRTDSFDGMGIIKEENVTSVNNIEDILSSFIGDYEQTVPIFSAQLYKGKKLFEYGHLNKEVPLPKKNGKIYKLEMLSSKYINVEDIRTNILTKLNNITGDFRQEKIIKQWEEYKFKVDKLLVCKFYAEVSRGLYIRSLSQDICDKLNTNGFVYSLVRTRNGNYTYKKCEKLDNIFGENYATILKS